MPGYVNQSGLSYKWQQSTTGAAGPFADVATGGTAIVYTTPVLTASAWYRCRINCANSGDSNFSSVVAIIVNTVNPVSANSASPSICVPGNGGTTLSASGALTYAWSPTTGLTPSTGIGSSVAALPSLTTLYTVVGTDAVGCTSSATVSLTVNSGISFTSVTASPANLCQYSNSTLTATLAALGTYCTAVYTTGTTVSDFITNVTLGSINNSTGASAAPFNTYYSALSTNLTAGSPYTVTGTLNNGGTEVVAIWIDYNQNGTFDASEKLGEQSLLSFSIGFTVPITALNGSTRMRVRNVYATTSIDPCISYTYGEVEDYNVNITGGASNNPAVMVWTPSTYLSSTTTPITTATAVAASTTYTVTATAGNGCTTTGTAALTVNILNAAPITTRNHFCPGSKDTLIANITGGGQPYVYSWSSSTGGVYPATATFIDTPTVTTTYTVSVTDACGNSVSGSVIVYVETPTIASTVPGSRCGYGTVNLGVTTSPWVSANWYSSATSNIPLAMGTNTYTTPSITSTTTYYVAGSVGGSNQISSNGVPTVSTSTQNGGLQFTLFQSVILNSIQVYSSAVGTATVTLENSAGTVMYVSPAIPISNLGISVPQTLSLGWAIPAGVGYRIKVANTGNSLGYSSGAFPAPMGNGVGTITNGWLTTTTSTLLSESCCI
jgi:hypothetical protein